MNLDILGLSKIEEKLLSKLIDYQELNAKKLVELTNHHKKVIYENISKLINKGFVGESVKEGVKQYSFLGPESIKSKIIEEKERLVEKEKKIEELIKKIEEKPKIENSEIENFLYKGHQSIRAFFEKLLKSKEYLVIGAPEESISIMGETFWHNFHRKQEEKKIKAKMIFNKSLKIWKIKNPFLKVKYLDEIEPLAEIIVFEDIVGIIIWTEKPTINILKGEIISKSYKDFFNLLWKKAKK